MKNEELGMSNGKKMRSLYSLIPLEDFKAVLNVDDRDDKLSCYCLTTATYSIEEFCHRRLTEKKYFEDLAFWGDRALPLSHYPVRKILAVYRMGNREWGAGNWEMLDPELYRLVPECRAELDIPCCLILAKGVRLLQGEFSLRVVYRAGFSCGKAPVDLASACLELAAWNMARYKGRKIGITGNGRGQGERLEIAMPENVRGLLEPYRLKLL